MPTAVMETIESMVRITSDISSVDHVAIRKHTTDVQIRLSIKESGQDQLVKKDKEHACIHYALQIIIC